MNVLAIDTSSRFLSVAIKRDDQRIFEYVSASSLSHNEEISRSCLELLEQAEISLPDISRIVLGSGPGSFTGLRIGFCFTQGLCAARSVPVLPLASSLGAAFLFYSPTEQRNIIVLSKANKNEVFASSYAFLGGSIQSHEKTPSLLENAVLEDHLSGKGSKDLYLITTDEDVLESLQKMEALKALHPQACLVKHIATGLIAASQASEYADSWQAQSAGDLSALTPDYVQKVAAKTILEREKSTTT